MLSSRWLGIRDPVSQSPWTTRTRAEWTRLKDERWTRPVSRPECQWWLCPRLLAWFSCAHGVIRGEPQKRDAVGIPNRRVLNWTAQGQGRNSATDWTRRKTDKNQSRHRIAAHNIISGGHVAPSFLKEFMGYGRGVSDDTIYITHYISTTYPYIARQVNTWRVWLGWWHQAFEFHRSCLCLLSRTFPSFLILLYAIF